MKKLLAFLLIISILNSCSENDTSQETQLYVAPSVRSYTTYTSENSVTLNGFIDLSNIVFQEPDTYNVGFIFRTGSENDSSNDQVIELQGDVEYYNGTYTFNQYIGSLEPNTTYYYTAYTKNGSSEKDDWEVFTTSDFPCTYAQDNYLSISGTWQNANLEITEPLCCDEGNVGFRFGSWPNIYEINFNELNNGYPNTGQYFGVDYWFDISYIERELVKSTNQVLIGNDSTPETELFVNNDGETITLVFCNTILRDGNILNGKVSVAIPQN
ncbi:hypothetical protein Q4Q35_05480 [Flavivirga aquimarina]|uniref:Fibronectin type-III domain-containing protein n=1 Tax=Flavivirga aquimarina TaxID=2027862 RepID=A0ABT8W7Z2_9FLAO|nr:hypothetical protein [Flavivirga aquimarina]MDO5969253.1 hypothetical protein [Flavivirga aquimarina]